MRIRSRGHWIAGMLGCIPLLVKLPYMFRTWGSSPSDRLDWIFPIFFLGAMAIVSLTSEEYWAKKSVTAIVSLIVLLLGYFVGLIVDINAMAIFMAIAVWWTWLWGLLGWRQAFNLVPVFGILALATTSSTYWLCVYTGTSLRIAFGLKLFAMIFFLGWTVLGVYFRLYISQRSAILWFAILASCAMLGHLKSTTKTYQGLMLDFQAVSGNYLGIELDATSDSKRFFRTSEAHHYRFADNDNIFELLYVVCGSDIHEIHPASHCLRAAGWNMRSEALTEYKVGERTYAVTELLAERGGKSMLVWVWYSSPEFSTGNFLSFRKNWHPSQHWETYQLAVMHHNDIARSRAALEHILLSLERDHTIQK